MEWVETTARTVDEAKERALDQLGVAEDDAEFEVLEEPRPGLFGRLRGEARVRARVRPTQPRPKLDRRERRKKAERGGRRGEVAGPAAPGASATVDGAATLEVTEVSDDEDTDSRPGAADDADAGAGATRANGDRPARSGRRGRRGGRRTRPAGERSAATDDQDPDHDDDDPASTSQPTRNHTEDEMDAAQVGDEAVRFVDGLVRAFGLDGTTTVRRDGDDLEVRVDGSDLGLLVGPRGQTLQAVQELTRVAAQRRLGDHDTRLRVDVAGYRERRKEALSRFAAQVAAEVVEQRAARMLEPMSSADRKVVHDALSGIEGVATRSVGEDPNRRIVIEPAADPTPADAPADDDTAD